MRFTATFLTVLFISLGAAQAEGFVCPAAPAPQVVVTPHEDLIIYDYNQNRAAMNALGHDILAGAHADARTYVGGLAHGVIATQMRANFQTMTQSQRGAAAGNGSGCIWITQVTVTLNYQPTIYVSREYQPETCYRRAVLEHEHKHVMIDRQLIQDYLPVLQQAAQTAAQATGVIGPVSEGELQAISGNLENQLSVQLKTAMDQLSAERNRRQAMVDTPQEYARVQAQCQQWP